MPLKSIDEIDSLCDGSVFIDVYGGTSSEAEYKVLCKHFLVEMRSYRTNRFLKILDHGIAHLQIPFMRYKELYNKLYQGSAVWSIPIDFAKYVLSLEKQIKKEYRLSLAADEVFMVSTCMNSPYKNRVSSCKNARYINWKEREGNSPKVFTMNDVDEVHDAIENKGIMFARKFSSERDLKIVQYVEDNVLNGHDRNYLH